MMERVAENQKAQRLAGGLLLAVDVLIGILIFLLPFMMGGREAWGHWLLITAALALGAAWCAWAAVSGEGYRFSWLEIFLLAGLALAWYQVQPQSPNKLAQFSSEYQRLLPTWAATQSGSETEAWSTVSVTPGETRHAWWVFLAYAVILTVVFQRIRQPEDCRRLLKWVGIGGMAMTGFGLLQWATSNGRFFWFYEHPYTDTTVHLKGAFSNRNHFAQFLALSIAPLMWWLFRDIRDYMQTGDRSTGSSQTSRRERSRQRKQMSGSGFRRTLGLPILALLTATALVVVAVLLSLSRGGMIAAGAATLIAVLGLWRGFRLGGALAVVLLGGSLILLGLLTFSDQEQLQTKLDQLISADVDSIDTGGNRQAIWAADAKVIRQFPLLGTGVGSHRDVYTLYMDNYADFAQNEMTHAESSFIHAALETGLIGVGCLIAALLFFLVRLIVGMFRTNSEQERACAIAVGASAVGGILHAVVDFIWYVPAIVVVSLVLVAAGLRSISRGFGTSVQPAGIPFPRIGWAVVGGLCIVALVRAQPHLMSRITAERHLYAALRMEVDIHAGDSDGYEDLQAGDAIQADDRSAELTAEAKRARDTAALRRRESAELSFLMATIKHLSASLEAFPEQHRVQLMLADRLRELFDKLQMKSGSPFALKMLRDAAESSGFRTRAELNEWLQQNCGSRLNLVVLADRLVRRSLAACPVQGHAYLALMETAFLDDPRNAIHQPLIDQAMLVRGNDPRVRFIAGREAILKNDWETGMALWESVFHSNQYFRLTILQMCAPQLPAEYFLQQFHPDAMEVKDLLTVYDSLDRPRDSTVLLQVLCRAVPEYAQDVENDDERLELMMQSYQYARRLEDLELCVTLLSAAAEEFPLSFEPRYHLGMTLVELERPNQAIDHLQWCYDQDPGNIWIPKLIVRAKKQMLKEGRNVPEQVTQL